MDYFLLDEPGNLDSTLQLAHLEQYFDILVFQPDYFQGPFFTKNQRKS